VIALSRLPFRCFPLFSSSSLPSSSSCVLHTFCPCTRLLVLSILYFWRMIVQSRLLSFFCRTLSSKVLTSVRP
jgi:hypothetical protein